MFIKCNKNTQHLYTVLRHLASEKAQNTTCLNARLSQVDTIERRRWLANNRHLKNIHWNQMSLDVKMTLVDIQSLMLFSSGETGVKPVLIWFRRLLSMNIHLPVTGRYSVVNSNEYLVRCFQQLFIPSAATDEYWVLTSCKCPSVASNEYPFFCYRWISSQPLITINENSVSSFRPVNSVR